MVNEENDCHSHIYEPLSSNWNHSKTMMLKMKVDIHVQSNFGRSNSPVSNTRVCSNSFVGPGNFPIHLMLKYTPGSNSDGSNSRTQSTVRRAIFHIKTL